MSLGSATPWVLLQNFYDFKMARMGIFQNKWYQSILGPCYFWWFCLVFCKFTK